MKTASQPDIQPDILPSLENADKIDTIVTDLDNNLWDWVVMHAKSMEAMAHKMSLDTGIDYDEIKNSMRRVYGAAGTLDFSGLVENMDIIHSYAREQAEKVIHSDSAIQERTRSVVQSGVLVQLLLRAFKAYERKYRETFKLYPGINDAVRLITENRKRIIVLTDAPYQKAINRLRRFKLDKYVSQLFGQEERPLDFDNQSVGTNDSALSLQLQAIKASVPYLTQFAAEIEAKDDPSKVEFPYTVIGGTERKPNVNLSQRLNMPPEDVLNRVVVWGDNPEKDGGLALGIDHKTRQKLPIPQSRGYLYSDYGQTNNPETAALLASFGSQNAVNKNLSAGDEVLADLSSLQESLAGRTRTDIIRITHPLQILDVLGIKRP